VKKGIVDALEYRHDRGGFVMRISPNFGEPM